MKRRRVNDGARYLHADGYAVIAADQQVLRVEDGG